MKAAHAKKSGNAWALRLRRLGLSFCIAAAFTLIYSACILYANSRASCELVFNDENAVAGLAPDGTHLSVSCLKSQELLARAAKRAGVPGLEPSLLAQQLEITPVETEHTPSKTRYVVTYRGSLLPGEGVSAREMLNAVLEEYRASFGARYFTGIPVPQTDWGACEALEYCEIGGFLQRECSRLARFLESETETYGAGGFASLSRRLENFAAVEIENYNAYVRQSGLAKNRSRLSYALQKRALLQGLSGAEENAEDEEQDAVLLKKLSTSAGSAEATAKAEQMLQSMEATLTELQTEAAALHAGAAARRAQEALTILTRPGRFEGWRISWALASGAALFCVLCAGQAVFSRRGAQRCDESKTNHKFGFKRCFSGLCFAALLAGALFGWYAAQHQGYTASALLWRGSAPTKADIFSEQSIRAAFASYGFTLDLDAARTGGRVKKYKENEAVYEVSLTLGAKDCTSAEQARFALDALLDVYFSQSESASAVPVSAEHIYEPGHDYIEQYERLCDFINEILAQIERCQNENALTAPAGGYSLEELAAEYRALRDGQAAYLAADILQNRLTKDRGVLLKKYGQRVQAAQGRTAGQIALDKQVLKAFSQKAPSEASTQAARERVENGLAALRARLEELHPFLLSALKTYDARNAAAETVLITPVTAKSTVRVWFYALLGAAGVFLGGCCILCSLCRLRSRHVNMPEK